MEIEFDESKRTYRSPKRIVEDFQREWSRPSELARACEELLSFLDKEYEEAYERVVSYEARALRLDREGVFAKGRAILEHQWRENAQASLDSKRKPIWYFITVKPGVYRIQNFPPSGPYLECQGPRAFTEKELKHERSMIEPDLKRERETWSPHDIIQAVRDFIVDDQILGDTVWDFISVYTDMQRRFEFRNLFRYESQELRNMGRAILHPKSEEMQTEIPESSQGTTIDNRIPWAGTEQELFDVLKCLSKAELLFPGFCEDRDEVLSHFMVYGVQRTRKKPREKIHWRGTLYDLLAWFDWMVLNRVLSEQEGRSINKLVCSHVSRKGNPIRVDTLRAIRSGVTHESPMKSATEKIKFLLKNIFDRAKETVTNRNIRRILRETENH